MTNSALATPTSSTQLWAQTYLKNFVAGPTGLLVPPSIPTPSGQCRTPEKFFLNQKEEWIDTAEKVRARMQRVLTGSQENPGLRTLTAQRLPKDIAADLDDGFAGSSWAVLGNRIGSFILLSGYDPALRGMTTHPQAMTRLRSLGKREETPDRRYAFQRSVIIGTDPEFATDVFAAEEITWALPLEALFKIISDYADHQRPSVFTDLIIKSACEFAGVDYRQYNDLRRTEFNTHDPRLLPQSRLAFDEREGRAIAEQRFITRLKSQRWLRDIDRMQQPSIPNAQSTANDWPYFLFRSDLQELSKYNSFRVSLMINRLPGRKKSDPIRLEIKLRRIGAKDFIDLSAKGQNELLAQITSTVLKTIDENRHHLP